MKKVVRNETPRLCLFAFRVVKEGEEIRYDYGPDDGYTMHWQYQRSCESCNNEFASTRPNAEKYMNDEVLSTQHSIDDVESCDSSGRCVAGNDDQLTTACLFVCLCGV